MVAGTTLLRFFSANRSAVTIGVNVLLDEIHPISLHTSYYHATLPLVIHIDFICFSRLAVWSRKPTELLPHMLCGRIADTPRGRARLYRCYESAERYVARARGAELETGQSLECEIRHRCR